MNANSRLPALSVFVSLLASLALAACVPPPAGTTASPSRPTPRPTPRPTLVPTQSPLPSAPPASTDWRDSPLTPGTWRLSESSDGLRADFADRFSMRCSRADGGIVLTVRGPATGASTSLRVTTDTREQLLPARASADGLLAVLAARDPLNDAVAFSRGRFRVVTSEGRALTMPSWTEISRVIESCR